MKKPMTMLKEGSAKDIREDRSMAKKRGMKMSEWESSSADAKHDSVGMKTGGKVSGGMGKVMSSVKANAGTKSYKKGGKISAKMC